jgi:hypothetical protein
MYAAAYARYIAAMASKEPVAMQAAMRDLKEALAADKPPKARRRKGAPYGSLVASAAAAAPAGGGHPAGAAGAAAAAAAAALGLAPEAAPPPEEEADDDLAEIDTYALYRPARLRIGRPHPTPIVETKALATISPPDVWYQLHLP